VKIQLEVPIECCACKRLTTSLTASSHAQAPRIGSLIVCGCGAVLKLCGTLDDPHTHQVSVPSPEGPRPITKEEAIAFCTPQNAPMN